MYVYVCICVPRVLIYKKALIPLYGTAVITYDNMRNVRLQISIHRQIHIGNKSMGEGFIVDGGGGENRSRLNRGDG